MSSLGDVESSSDEEDDGVHSSTFGNNLLQEDEDDFFVDENGSKEDERVMNDDELNSIFNDQVEESVLLDESGEDEIDDTKNSITPGNKTQSSGSSVFISDLNDDEEEEDDSNFSKVNSLSSSPSTINNDEIIVSSENNNIQNGNSAASHIFITPSHTPFNLTKSNIPVPIDTIHPSWKTSITLRSIEQQKLEIFKGFVSRENSIKKHFRILDGKLRPFEANASTLMIKHHNNAANNYMDNISDLSSSSTAFRKEEVEDESDASTDSDTSSHQRDLVMTKSNNEQVLKASSQIKEITVQAANTEELRKALTDIKQSKKQMRKKHMDKVLKKSKEENKFIAKPGSSKKAIQKQQKMAYRQQLKKMPLKELQGMGKKIIFTNTQQQQK
ncbi:hypothetical protein C9374_006000 [Naegleria lovaniensis]|uniref:Uncharacterized protein n=1 Tax=Naegleria lovaniensis TaxID=51637 RepID=A0AA88G908_NAELO|nr:uncharacterized protein C9374_014217 [Naegleria lovaniensis]XP_044547296.1 uncharacterized protein C9374_006000 [Naegleria lovaniensis]KAG2370802.1 hypothetical protein C9374_014217 [Naegleria lovaniensis]KAG2381616.1 hypothetical protein C9374_006000 [Naegleria lovaniensis]